MPACSGIDDARRSHHSAVQATGRMPCDAGLRCRRAWGPSTPFVSRNARQITLRMTELFWCHEPPLPAPSFGFHTHHSCEHGDKGRGLLGMAGSLRGVRSQFGWRGRQQVPRFAQDDKSWIGLGGESPPLKSSERLSFRKIGDIIGALRPRGAASPVAIWYCLGRRRLGSTSFCTSQRL